MKFWCTHISGYVAIHTSLKKIEFPLSWSHQLTILSSSVRCVCSWTPSNSMLEHSVASSSIGYHRCYEFMWMEIHSCLEYTVFLWSSLTSASEHLSITITFSLIILEPWRGMRHRCPICGWAFLSNLFSTFLTCSEILY